MKDNPILYRKCMIPEECVLLKDDEILEITDDIIITRWNTLKPKRELHHGFSCYFLKHGFKVSKFFPMVTPKFWILMNLHWQPNVTCVMHLN